MTRVCLKKKINRNLCNALNPQIKNLEYKLQETGKKALTACAVLEGCREFIKLRSKLCFLMTWFCMWQIKLTFMQCNMVKVILTFWWMKSYQHLYFNKMKQSHVQWAEIDFERYFKPSFGWQHTDYRRYIIQSRSTIWKAEFQFQTVWFICQSQPWWKHYLLLWETRNKTNCYRKAIRFGFTLWCITSSEGYLFYVEPYCG